MPIRNSAPRMLSDNINPHDQQQLHWRYATLKEMSTWWPHMRSPDFVRIPRRVFPNNGNDAFTDNIAIDKVHETIAGGPA